MTIGQGVVIPRGLGVFTRDLETGLERRVTPPGMLAHSPAWSPDGRLLAFARYRVPRGFSAVTEIALVRPDGGGLRVLTTCQPPECQGDGSPAFSPDGSKIAFVRVFESGTEIFVADVDGGEPTQITHLPRISAWGGPQWSSDGQTIAFSAHPLGGDEWSELYLAAAAGGDVTRITYCRQPLCERGYWFASWSPVAGVLAAVHGYAGRGDLELLRPDGTVIRRLTHCNGPCEDSSPSWSPDGRYVGFVRSVTGWSGALWAVRADGRGLQQLRGRAPWACCLAWQPG